ncbi:MAG: hypothetical protein HPY55_06565 [Firmicutes bacterium]|nr:hypothetical protein [Bacillota bacterium]
MYGSQAEVIAITGVKPEDLECADQAALETLIGGWLEDAKALIDAETRRDFDAEVAAGTIPEVPRGVKHVAVRLVANMVAVSLQRRRSPVVQMGQFEIQISGDDVFTPALRRDLAPFKKRSRIGLYLVGQPDEETL